MISWIYERYKGAARGVEGGAVAHAGEDGDRGAVGGIESRQGEDGAAAIRGGGEPITGEGFAAEVLAELVAVLFQRCGEGKTPSPPLPLSHEPRTRSQGAPRKQIQPPSRTSPGRDMEK